MLGGQQVGARSRRVLTSYLLAVSGLSGGGTTEIQRNIIAQRGLGLPGGSQGGELTTEGTETTDVFGASRRLPLTGVST